MPQSHRKLSLPLAASLLLAFAFAGCASETQLLNSAVAGDGGDDGAVSATGGQPAAGRGGSSQAGHAGTTSPATGGSAQAVGGGPATGGTSSGGTGTATGGSPEAGEGSGHAVGGTPATGGSAGGGSSGMGGTPSVGACTSSDGTGCEASEFCVDRELDACGPDSAADCDGLCATQVSLGRCRLAAVDVSPDQEPCGPDFECVSDPLGVEPATNTDGVCIGLGAPPCDGDHDCGTGFRCSEMSGAKRCLPESATCRLFSLCDVGIPACPPGFAAADADLCDYVCVPLDHCGCARDGDCIAPSTCDRVTHRCEVAKSPAPRCLEPFDVGPCEAALGVFAFIDGRCQEATFGGCSGNDNRFGSLEECMSSCEGSPLEHECPEGRVVAAMCPGCGPAGGCPDYGSYCAKPCGGNEDCDTAGLACYDGICQATLCD
jgi:hypothetical protein